jgi:hypothetical protein
MHVNTSSGSRCRIKDNRNVRPNTAKHLNSSTHMLYSIDGNPQGKLCEATLAFTDSYFLPVHFGFPSLNCLGIQIVEFNIPLEAPNGDAYIWWYGTSINTINLGELIQNRKCAGQAAPACNHITINQGTDNADAIILDQVGQIDCRVPTATLTTLLTLSNSLTTSIENLISTYFTTTEGQTYHTSASTPNTGSTVLVTVSLTSLSTSSSTTTSKYSTLTTSTPPSTPSVSTSFAIVSTSSSSMYTSATDGPTTTP